MGKKVLALRIDGLSRASQPTFKEVEALERANAFLEKRVFVPSKESRQFQVQLHSLPDAQIQKLLEDFLMNFDAAQGDINGLEQLAQILPLEILEKVIERHFDTDEPLLDQVKEKALETKLYLEAHTEHEQTWGEFFRKIFSSILVAIESIVMAFGIPDLFKSSDDKFSSEFKFQKISMILAFITAISTICVPLLGAVAGSLVVAGLFGSLILLSIIFPYIAPIPSTLPKCENWSQKCRDGLLDHAEGRKSEVDMVAQTLMQGNKHAMIIGQSGVGKTQIVKGLIHAIRRGDYPELKGKEVFYVNTAELISDRGWNISKSELVNAIADKMGRHRDDIVLVMDEIHLACQQREEVAMGDQLKTMLDPGSGKFPHIIGITTKKEYERDIVANNPAFARRFKLVEVESTNEDETIAILHEHLLKKAPEVIAEEGVLEYLYAKVKENFPEGPQPFTALNILSEAIQYLSDGDILEKQQRLEKLKFQRSAATLRRSKKDGSASLSSTIRDLQQEIEREKQLLTQLREKARVFARVNDRIYRVADKILISDSPSDFDIRRFGFLKLFASSLLGAIDKESGDRPFVLNERVIDLILRH